jgi:hypothetical protein
MRDIVPNIEGNLDEITCDLTPTAIAIRNLSFQRLHLDGTPQEIHE